MSRVCTASELTMHTRLACLLLNPHPKTQAILDFNHDSRCLGVVASTRISRPACVCRALSVHLGGWLKNGYQAF